VYTLLATCKETYIYIYIYTFLVTCKQTYIHIVGYTQGNMYTHCCLHARSFGQSQSQSQSQSQNYFTTGGLLLVHLGDKTVGAHDQRLFVFATELLYDIFTDEQLGLSLMNRLRSCQVYVSHIQHRST
jgi:hypothetical protein